MEPDKIAGFIRRHHVMTLATVGRGGDGSGGGGSEGNGGREGRPWCAHVFYAWMAAGKMPNGDGRAGCFVFTTDPATRHGAEMEAGGHVAAGIALETRMVGRVQGLQIEGEVRRAEGDEIEKARRAYLRRFPYAAAGELRLWLLRPTLMKLTDNTLGFGKKLVWEGGKSGGRSTL